LQSPLVRKERPALNRPDREEPSKEATEGGVKVRNGLGGGVETAVFTAVGASLDPRPPGS